MNMYCQYNRYALSLQKKRGMVFHLFPTISIFKEANMLPLLGLAAAAVSALSAGQATAIGAGVGAATVIGANAHSKRKQSAQQNTDESSRSLDEAEVEQVVREVLKKMKQRGTV
jgi:hypothetical protein